MPRLLRIVTLFRSRSAAHRRALALRLDPVATTLPAAPVPVAPPRFRAPALRSAPRAS